MNKKYFSRTIFGTVLLLLAACTNDELTDGDSLPEGKYPLEIASVNVTVESTTEPWGAKSPQTRVSENPDGNSSHWNWDGKEQIGVQLYADGDVATYTLNSGKTLTADKTLYWQNTQTTTINAWYPMNETVSLADQSGGIAYVLKGSGQGNYQNPVTLNFSHQLAKVRIVFTGANASKVTNVKIESYTQCTNEKGSVKDGTSAGEITMCKTTLSDEKECWEANVVPGYGISKIKVNGATATITKTVTPMAGQLHTITVGVNPIEININDGSGNIEIDEGEYVLKGNSSESARPIVVNGNADITLDNVQLKTTGDVMTIKNGVSVTLNVKGTNNKFTSTDGAGIKIMEMNYIGPGGSITINGTNASNSKLEITAASGAAIGFRMYGELNSKNTIYGGNIGIKNITLVAHGGSGSPAIGLSALENDSRDCQKKYGNISIDASTLTVTSEGGAACIGTPYHNTSSPFSLGTISITNSTVTATAKNDQAACIGFGYTANTAGSKVIQKIEFTNTTLNLTTSAETKVGFGVGDDSRKLTEGIWKDGSKVGTTSWNP